jgi:isocitrate dehydrogenase
MTASAISRTDAPSGGEAISYDNGKLKVPDNPVIPFIEGDGIGVDITPAARTVFDAAVSKAYGGRKRVKWHELFAGEKAFARYNDYLPDETLSEIKRFRVAIKGPLTTPVGKGFRSLNVSIRRKLDLYACIRPVRYFNGVPSPVKNPQKLDVVIFRENTEDVYAGYEWESGSKAAGEIIGYLKAEHDVNITEASGIGLKPISPFATKRLMRKAIRYALENGRKSVTVVHKGNIMKFTEGAFMNWAFELAKEEFADSTVFEGEKGGGSPGKILIKERIADSMFQQVLTRPDEYDVIVCPNLNGDYLSDACAAQVGGLGIAPGANIGDGAAVFEATHGTAPKYTGLDKVNPGSLILSGALMFEHMGWSEASDAIVSAFEKTVANKTVTYDLARQIEGAGEIKTSEFAREIVGNMG